MRPDLYDDLPVISYKRTFDRKSDAVKCLIRESLQILGCLGIPIDEFTQRQREKMAMALLAVGDVKKTSEWKRVKDSRASYAPTTREIIEFHNAHLEEHISRGSYDDIRRQDLAPMLVCGIVRRSSPDSNLSDPRRGYQINPEYARIIKNYGQPDWFEQVELFNRSHLSYQERLSVQRDLPRISVHLPDGRAVALADGEHNAIQKAVVEEFLTRFGYGAELLYLGDSDNKYGVVFEKERLKELGFADLRTGTLPDVIAYSPQRDWVFLIEAYHTSNPINPSRRFALAQIAGDASGKSVFVTAFQNIASYKEALTELAWETEVWIATDPDHLIHRDGQRFLGPYSRDS